VCVVCVVCGVWCVCVVCVCAFVGADAVWKSIHSAQNQEHVSLYQTPPRHLIFTLIQSTPSLRSKSGNA